VAIVLELKERGETKMEKLLSEEEVQGILSMNLYWEEVIKREDTSPLRNELKDIVRILGTKILFIIAEYAKLQKEEEMSKKNGEESP